MKLAFKIKNEKVSEMLQKLLFKLGYKWADESQKIKHLDSVLITLNNKGIYDGSTRYIRHVPALDYQNNHELDSKIIDLTLLEILADTCERGGKNHLKNEAYSFKIKNVSVSKLLQELLFEHGFEWKNGSSQVEGLYSHCILLLHDKKLQRCINGQDCEDCSCLNGFENFKPVDLSLLEILTEEQLANESVPNCEIDTTIESLKSLFNKTNIIIPFFDKEKIKTIIKEFNELPDIDDSTDDNYAIVKGTRYNLVECE